MKHRRWFPARTLSIVATIAMLAILSCGDDAERYAPLDDGNTPRDVVVAGTVRATDGPVADVIVAMEASTDGVTASVSALTRESALKTGGDAASVSAAARRVTSTDAAGRFAFSGVDAGDYALQFIANDHRGAFLAISVPEPSPTLDTIIVDVNLTPTGTFSGVALLENAAAHQGTVVYAQGTSYVAVTDPAGNYAITDVPVASYTVRAEHANYLEDTESGTITMAGENVALPGMLLRINSNIPPVATIASAAPLFGGVPVDFVASGSDVDGTVVLYEWDWEDDGIFDASSPSTGNASHTYTVGTYRAKFRVTDDDGGIGLAVIDFTISPAPLNTVYVSATTGNDLNDGSVGSPVKTLAAAYVIAQTNSYTEIQMEAAVYNAVPAFLDGIDILGGRDLPGWEEGAGYTQFSMGAVRATANNITSATLIRRVQLVCTIPLATNSIALYAINSTSALQFEECRFLANNGGSAPPGASGSPGTNGGAGAPGSNGSCDGNGAGTGGAGGSSPVGCAGGVGGAGGNEGANSGAPGASGLCGGGLGGSGGSGGDPGGAGGGGQLGAIGALGIPGVAGSAAGTVIAGEWIPSASTNGSAGTNGRGGGGGGGGGGQGCTFCDDGAGNGGGGGGGGATGSGGGSGALGGYGSFAVFLWNASPTFTGCYFQPGNGGVGGNGGACPPGGIGGSGGQGATFCTGEIGRGGNGGKGGDGGGGGGGAGGPGGPSYGVYKASGSAPAIVGATYVIGSPGSGGNGGANGGGGFAPSGPVGLSGNTN